MKKLVLFLSLLATISTNVSFAQLKVLANGTVQTNGSFQANNNATVSGDISAGNDGLSVVSNFNDWSDAGPLSCVIRGWLYQYNYDFYQPKPRLMLLGSDDGAWFEVSSAGCVGILTDYPYCALEVGTYNAPQQVKVNGTIVLGSDERIKENIKDIDNSTSSLTRLRSVSYVFKKEAPVLKSRNNKMILDSLKNKIPKFNPRINPDNRTHFGFLAQDVQKVFPELVYKDSLGMLGVDYIGMIPLLVNAIKEQQTTISNLNDKINAMEVRLPKTDVSLTSASKLKRSDLNVPETDVLTYPVLDQNIPNPFNTATTIGYYLPATVNSAVIYVYDMNGTQLKSCSIKERGKSSIIIQGSELNAGMYLYALIADGKVIDTKRMILTK